MKASAWRNRLIGLALTAIVLIALWLMLPQAYDQNLSHVGQGRPALVFVYDKNLLASGDQIRQFDRVRPQLEARVHVLIADTGRPDAQDFMRSYGAESITSVLISADGRELARHRGVLRGEDALALVEQYL